ncbi:MAG: NAD(P)-dependent oxidoreductase [Candidatus Thorarchaeota archaeon]|jgi:phosphoglycerate dehydrogenase-like enzyme
MHHAPITEAIILKVLVPYGDELADKIREIVGDMATVVQSTGAIESMLENGRDAEIIASGRVSSEFIQATSNLRMIQAFGAGVDKVDFQAIEEHGNIIVCNSHVNAAEVAEYAITLLFTVAKNILASDKEIRLGDWRQSWGGPLPNIEIRGKTCLMLGLGNIGSEIAKRLRALGVKINALTRSGTARDGELVEKVVSMEDYEDLVQDADFVMLSLPLTKKSEGLVDAKFISQKRIYGAALDVWWEYPKKWGGSGKLPSEQFPFHELDNVVLSPHRAAYSENIRKDQIAFVGENILRFLRGEKPLNIIDTKLGY